MLVKRVEVPGETLVDPDAAGWQRAESSCCQTTKLIDKINLTVVQFANENLLMGGEREKMKAKYAQRWMRFLIPVLQYETG